MSRLSYSRLTADAVCAASRCGNRLRAGSYVLSTPKRTGVFCCTSCAERPEPVTRAAGDYTPDSNLTPLPWCDDR